MPITAPGSFTALPANIVPSSTNGQRLAGYLGLAGFFLYLVLSAPLLDSVGFHYSTETGPAYAKIHPGTYFLTFAVIVLFANNANRLDLIYDLYKRHTAILALFVFYVVTLIYMMLRDSPSGLAFMIDGHLAGPLCAILLCYIPLDICKKSIKCFIAIATLNSLLGLIEAIGKFRFLPFSDDINFLNEEYFRASAIFGYPLANAILTSVALFIMLALPYRPSAKAVLAAIFLASLVAFGGRSALTFSIVFLLCYGALIVKNQIRKNLSLQQAIFLTMITLLTPILLFGGTYALVNSDIGERISAYSDLNDDSASSRILAFSAVDYMSETELWCGVSLQRIEEITDSMNQKVNLAHIENPWVLMFMHFGILLFVPWLVILSWFMYRLTKNETLALKMAVIIYFCIASTFNSFATKSAAFPIMIFAALCISRIATPQKYAPRYS